MEAERSARPMEQNDTVALGRLAELRQLRIPVDEGEAEDVGVLLDELDVQRPRACSCAVWNTLMTGLYLSG